MRRRAAVACLGAGLLGLAGCTGGNAAGSPTRTPPGTIDAALDLTSPAFASGDPIPTRYTCDGADVSPPLDIGGDPGSAASLTLVMDDPDAPGGTFTHWLVWGLPPDTRRLPAGLPTGGTLHALDDARQGTNDQGRVGYGGPCPPPGDGPHTYRFRLVALGTPIDLDPGADRDAVDAALRSRPHTGAFLTGEYER